MLKGYIFFAMLLSLAGGSLIGCSSTPLEPEKIKVQVEREAPSDKECREIGVVTGTTLTMKGSSAEALEDLKEDAARKGANYVHLHDFSAIGSSARGTGYFCP